MSPTSVTEFKPPNQFMLPLSFVIRLFPLLKPLPVASIQTSHHNTHAPLSSRLSFYSGTVYFQYAWTWIAGF
jgi:hypothetical protein